MSCRYKIISASDALTDVVTKYLPSHMRLLASEETYPVRQSQVYDPWLFSHVEVMLLQMLSCRHSLISSEK